MYLIHEEYQGCFRDLFMHFGTENAELTVGSRSVREMIPLFQADGSWRELESEMEKMNVTKYENWLHIRQQFIPMSENLTIMTLVSKIEYEGRLITDRDEIADVLSGYYQAVAFINLNKNKRKVKPVTFFAATTKAEMLRYYSNFFNLPFEETGMRSNIYSKIKEEFEKIK